MRVGIGATEAAAFKHILSILYFAISTLHHFFTHPTPSSSLSLSISPIPPQAPGWGVEEGKHGSKDR